MFYENCSMKIVVAEDEVAIAEILAANLLHDGFDPIIINNGLDVLEYLKLDTPQLILLDVMLPGINGYDVCRQIRQHSLIPVIMLTARVSEADRLKGFEIGADDYVCKPFSPREVVARIKSVLRRAREGTAINDELNTVKNQTDASGFSICQQTLSASFLGRPLDLTCSEFNLLKLFVSQPNRVFERNRLLEMLNQHGNDCTDRAIDSHIKNLRRKLRDISPDQNIIQSIYGVGYKLFLSGAK